jgi:hypothetical protein
MALSFEDLFAKDSNFPSYLMPMELATVAGLNKKYRDLISSAGKMWKNLSFIIFKIDKKLPQKTWRQTFAHLWAQDIRLRREVDEEMKNPGML